MTVASDDANLQAYCEERALQCRIERHALDLWLGRVVSLRVIALASATLASLMAALAVWLRPAVLGDGWSDLALYGSALSAALTGVYLLKRPERHQSECERLVRGYKHLEQSFRALQFPSSVDTARKAHELNAELTALRESAKATPPEAFRDRAERELRVDRPLTPSNSSGRPLAELNAG